MVVHCARRWRLNRTQRRPNGEHAARHLALERATTRQCVSAMSIRSERSAVPTRSPSHSTSWPMNWSSDGSTKAGPPLRRSRKVPCAVSMNTASRSLLLPLPYSPRVTRPRRADALIGDAALTARHLPLMVDAVTDNTPVHFLGDDGDRNLHLVAARSLGSPDRQVVAG